MTTSANVLTLDVLSDVKAALIEFAEDAKLAISEAQADAQRTIWWIQNDRQSHWQRELKKRHEKLNLAKAELFRKQLESNDTRTSAVVERKAVQKCEAAVAEAEQRLRNIKKWHQVLEREYMLFKAAMQQVAGAAEGEIPVALARIERMIESLHAYVALQAPSADSPPPSGYSNPLADLRPTASPPSTTEPSP